MFTRTHTIALAAFITAFSGGAAAAFDFQTPINADRPVRIDTSAKPQDAFGRLSPSAGAVQSPSRAALIMGIPNPSAWKPYIGAGAGVYALDPLQNTSTTADYNFMAGTMLQTDADKKGRQHQLTLGYRYNETAHLSSAASSFARQPSHNLEMDWRYKF